MSRKDALFFIVGLMPWLASSAQPYSSHVVGYLRDDGIIAPYAVMEDNWERVSENVLFDIIHTEPYFYYYSNPDSVEIIHIGTHVTFNPYSMNSGDGFLSTYNSGYPGSNSSFPVDKLGIVLSWKTEAAIFSNKAVERDGYGHYDMRVSSQFHGEELEYVTNARSNREHEWLSIPVDSVLRDSFEIKIDYWTTNRKLDNTTITFFTALRWYPPEDSSVKCFSASQLQGWIIESEKGIEFAKRSFTIGDCDGKGFDSALRPYLAFELNDNLYMGAGLTHYEGESMQIYELKGKEVKALLQD